MHWTTDFYTLIDRADPAAIQLMALDISVRVGNHPETRGIEAMMAGELGHHTKVTAYSEHQFIDVWDVDDNLAALNSIVTYHRVDGHAITVPVLTVIGRNNQRLINRLHLFLDSAPLFKGLEMR